VGEIDMVQSRLKGEETKKEFILVSRARFVLPSPLGGRRLG